MSLPIIILLLGGLLGSIFACILLLQSPNK